MKVIANIGKYMIMLGIVFSRPEKFSIFRRRIFNEIEIIGINSIPIVVIAHANSRNTGGADQRLRTTYLPVESELMVGDLVQKADPIGNIASEQHFFGRTVLHWGERLNGEYKNPLRRLGAPVILPRLS